MRIRQMHRSDLGRCDELRRLVGWNQLPEDWTLFFNFSPRGCFVAEIDGGIVGTVTTVQYEKKIGWIGMLIVHPDFRGRGVGSQLLTCAIQFLQSESIPGIKLDAMPEGEPLYLKMGFRREFQITRWFRAHHLSLPDPDDLPFVTEADLPEISRLDQSAFGANRVELLRELRKRSLRTTISPYGFAMLRSGATANYLGPISSLTEEVTRDLVSSIVRETSPLIWDVPDLLDHARLPQEFGFAPQRTLARMTLGGSLPAPAPECYWGLVDPALG